MLRFTKENAREFALKANALRWSRFRARKAEEKAAAKAERLAAKNPKQPEIIPPTQAAIPAQPQIVIPVSPSDGYSYRRLKRVRKQLDMIDREIDKCITLSGESKRLKELIESQARLSDQEFALSNRPKPGNTRPEPAKPAARRAVPARPEVGPSLDESGS